MTKLNIKYQISNIFYILFLNFIMVIAASNSSEEFSITHYENRIVLDYKPKISLEPLGFENFTRVILKDGNSSFSVGDPDLPRREILIAVPANGEVQLEVNPKTSVSYKNISVAPVPQRFFDSTRYIKSSVYTRNEFFPESLAKIEEVSFFRDIRCARIIINSVQYNPQKAELKVYQEITLIIRIPHSPFRIPDDDYFYDVYKNAILNFSELEKQGVGSREQSAGNRLLTPHFWTDSVSPDQEFFKVKIETTGVYKITEKDFKRLGINLKKVNPKTIQLYNIGNYQINGPYPENPTEIPIYVYGEADSSFDKDDYILFYGLGVDYWDKNYSEYKKNLFTKYNYYWLTYGKRNGKRMARQNFSNLPNPNTLTKAPTIFHYEQDNDCPARSGLLWVWQLLTEQAPVYEISLPLSNLDTIEKIIIKGYQPSQDYRSNRLRIYLNSELVKTVHFANQSPLFITLDSLPKPDLEKNTLTLELSGSQAQQFYLDYFEFYYQQNLTLQKSELTFLLPRNSDNYRLKIKGVKEPPFILNTTEPRNPYLLSNFILKSDTLIFDISIEETTSIYISTPKLFRTPFSIERRNPSVLAEVLTVQPADYYIITPDEFYELSKSWARYRQNNIPGLLGATAKAVRLSEIYDALGFGIEEPGTIKAFFRLKRPYYGVLVGDALYDYRNALQRDISPGVPPYEYGYGFDPNVYDASVYSIDAWYADWEGQGHSPDMIIGRITVRNEPEFRYFLEKLFTYERERPYGSWNQRIILLADDEWIKEGEPDYGMEKDHTYWSDSVEFLIGQRLQPVKVFLTEYPFTREDEKRQARERFIKEFNRGAVLMSYFGHGAGFQLAHEQAFRIEDIPSINNGNRNPFCFFGSCGVGRWEDTRFEGLAEELARKRDGAIATVGASKATFSGDNKTFALRLFSSLLNPAYTVGKAFIGALPLEIKYHLFGDPATKLAIPETVYTLGLNPDTLKPGTKITVLDSTLSNSNNSVYYWTIYGPKWHRYYKSSARVQMNYNLPGIEIGQGIGTVKNGKIQQQIIIPRGLFSGTRYVPSGYYQEIPSSSRIIVSTIHNGRLIQYIKDSIPYDTAASPLNDTLGPEITLYADDRKITEGDYLPQKFQLTGLIRDSSGILLTDTNALISGSPLIVYVNNRSSALPLEKYFRYDNNSWTTGRFSIPFALELPRDSSQGTIYLESWDNLLNHTTYKVRINTSYENRLKLENVLVNPNPIKSQASFYFKLTKPGYVTIKIYSISGRLIKKTREEYFGFGENRIDWDGKDEFGISLPNGIYIYKITARTQAASSTGFQPLERSETIEKFLILH